MGKDHKDEYNFGDYEDAYKEYDPDIPGSEQSEKKEEKEKGSTWNETTWENTDWSAFDD